MKKLLLIIAFAIFGLGLNAQNVGDETTIDYDGYSLEFSITSVSPAECEVSSYTNSPTEVTIPSTVTISGTEFTVTSIGFEAFWYCSSLTSITFGENSQLTSIGAEAFSGCSSLTSITFGENSQLTSIGAEAFYGCRSLTSIEIPNSVTSIRDGAFSSCSSLTSIVVAEGNTVYDSRENCNAIIETSSNKLIAGCQNTVIPNSVTSIGWYAFRGCSSLTSIEIPNSVTSIGIGAFQACESLTSIVIPNSVTSIGDMAFSVCSSLTSIVVAEGNTVYDSRENCNAIIETSSNTLIAGCQNTVIPNSVTSIGYEVFSGCSSLTSIEIPNSVTYIDWFAFSSCSSLKVIKCYAEDVPETGDYVFDYCPSDMTIYVPEVSLENYKATSPWNGFNIMAIGGVGYYNVVNYGDYSLKFIITNTETAECEVVCDTKPTGSISITIPSSVEIEGTEYSVTSIGEWAFYSCSSLTSIEIPNSVTSIGYWAFEGCSSLRVIKCYAEDVPETGSSAFDNCPSDMIIYVPEVSLEDYKATSPWNKFIILPLNDNENLVPATPDTLFAEALSDTIVVLTWSAVDSVLGYNVYSVIDSTYTLLADSISDTTYTVKGLLPDSTYCFAVAAFNQVGESERKSVTVKTLKADDGSDDGNDDGNDNPTDTIVPEPEVLAIPENLVANALSTSSIILTWDIVENAESYNVYRDGDSIANVTNPTYTDKDLEYNTEYCYTVTAVSGDEESEESDEECVKTLGESLEELSSSINIYPNPVENELFLATEVRVNEVSIYDVYGRLCCRDASNASTSNSMDTFYVSVQDLEAGVYFVKVVTSEGEIVKRFVKK